MRTLTLVLLAALAGACAGRNGVVENAFRVDERDAWDARREPLVVAIEEDAQDDFVDEADEVLDDMESELTALGDDERVGDLEAWLDEARADLAAIGRASEDAWQDMGRAFVRGWNDFERGAAEVLG